MNQEVVVLILILAIITIALLFLFSLRNKQQSRVSSSVSVCDITSFHSFPVVTPNQSNIHGNDTSVVSTSNILTVNQPTTAFISIQYKGTAQEMTLSLLRQNGTNSPERNTNVQAWHIYEFNLVSCYSFILAPGSYYVAASASGISQQNATLNVSLGTNACTGNIVDLDTPSICFPNKRNS